MQTIFTEEQLTDSHMAVSEKILRSCVHCGFCTATCPTYVLEGDELDSPRGRIYLIKEMFEQGRAAPADVVTHLDRCLSCLSCMTTCPSGVNYMHLVDHARAHIEETYRRPWKDRVMRSLLAAILPYPRRFALALRAAALARPFAGVVKRGIGAPRKTPRLIDRLAALLALTPRASAACTEVALCLAGAGQKARPRGSAKRLRATGPRSAHQCGGDPAADAQWHRGCRSAGRGLLRRLGASHGQDTTGA